MSPRTYLTAAQVRLRYGNKSDSWLWRLLHSDPSFPRPIYLRKKRLFVEAELDAYDANIRGAPDASAA